MLFSPLRLARSSALRHVVAWVLVIALPMQCASAVLLALGPLHYHRHAPLLAPGASGTNPDSGLHFWIAKVVDTGTLALIDENHARAQMAQAHGRERPACPCEGESASLSTSDLRLAMASLDKPSPDSLSDIASAAPRLPHLMPHQHRHDGLHRHRHETGSPDVVALGDATSSLDTGTSGSTVSVDVSHGAIALSSERDLLTSPPASLTTSWSSLKLHPWHSHVAALLERPPRA